jgi:nucleoside-diphosphate-sugar epimerase
MRVLVAGGTGAIGRPLVSQLRDRGHDPVVLTRSAERAARLGVEGVEAVVGDALDAGGLVELVAQVRPEVVINQLTSLSRDLGLRSVRAGIARTGRLRREVSSTLVRAAEEAGVRRIVAQSVAFAYRPGPGIRTERDPLYTGSSRAIAKVVEPLVALERATLGSAKVEGAVLRYGALYGEGTQIAPDGAVVQMVRRRRLPIVGRGRGVFGFVHVEDAASATLAAMDSTPGTYNIVDSEPAPAHDWIPVLASLLGAKPPLHVPAALARMAGGAVATYLMDEQPAVSGNLARSELGWSPRFESWREGFKALLLT